MNEEKKEFESFSIMRQLMALDFTYTGTNVCQDTLEPWREQHVQQTLGAIVELRYKIEIEYLD